MNMDIKKITSGLILTIGIIAFILSIYNNNLNLALIYLTASLILWILFVFIMDDFDVQIFARIVSLSGFLVALSVLIMFGVEEVPYPIGAFIFHSGGIAIALGIGFFSIFPIIIIHQMSVAKTQRKIVPGKKLHEQDLRPEEFSDDWEQASDDDLQSGEFEVAVD